MSRKTIVCPLCGEEVAEDTFEVHFEAETYVLDRILKEHPDWKETDGSCKKCLSYYLSVSKK